MPSEEEIRLGVIGFGSFGLFAVQHFTRVKGVKLVGMAGTHREAAYAAAQRFGIPEPVEVEELLARDDVDLVYIATPPFLHYEQAVPALKAGKHVICEKPLALSVKQADEMLAIARDKELVMVADLMQRYNPVYDRVKELIDSKALGEPLHAYFENYATDEMLPPEHWFWDREKSGGIFVEHGVHFFDMFAGWLGEGRVVAGQATCRPTTGVEEQVHCTVRYGSTVLVNFYHGFHQPRRMDRQELRIVFERGDVTLYGWVPTTVCVHAVADEKQTRLLEGIFPGSRLDVVDWFHPQERAASARHKQIDIYHTFDLTFGEGDLKMHRYGRLLRDMMEDQAAWIRDRDHRRKITEQNGYNSLVMALEADRLAHQ